MSVCSILEKMMVTFVEEYSIDGDYQIILPEGIYEKMLLETNPVFNYLLPEKKIVLNDVMIFHGVSGKITVKKDPTKEIERKKSLILKLEKEIADLNKVY